MPLNKVFDAREGVLYPSPITSARRGRALRAETVLREKQSEELQQRIDADLPERQMSATEERLGIDQASNERLREEHDLAVQQWQQENGVKAATSAIKAYESTPGDEATKRKAGFDATIAYLDNALPGGVKEVFDYLEKNGESATWRSFDIAEARALVAPFQEPVKGIAINDKLVHPYTGKVMADLSDAGGDRAEQAQKFARYFDGESIDRWIKSGDFADLKAIQGSKYDGFKPTERQGKAMSWLNQALTGNEVMEDWLASDIEINWDEVAKYLTSIAEDEGPWTRQGVREFLLTQEELNFFDSVNLLVDPIVRQSTGAAVKNFEFAQWFNTLVPMSTDPSEQAQKSFARGRAIEGLKYEAGPIGTEIVMDGHTASPTPNFSDPTGSGQMEQLAEQQGYIPEPRTPEELENIPVGTTWRDTDGTLVIKGE